MLPFFYFIYLCTWLSTLPLVEACMPMQEIRVQPEETSFSNAQPDTASAASPSNRSWLKKIWFGCLCVTGSGIIGIVMFLFYRIASLYRDPMPTGCSSYAREGLGNHLLHRSIANKARHQHALIQRALETAHLINQPNQNGCTPLDAAEECGIQRIFNFLKEKGAQLGELCIRGAKRIP